MPVDDAFLKMLHVNMPMVEGRTPELTNISLNLFEIAPEDNFTWVFFGGHFCVQGKRMCGSIAADLVRGNRTLGRTNFTKVAIQSTAMGSSERTAAPELSKVLCLYTST